jgi:glycosyltransferase involved in cell wall biosynthesis
MYEASNTILIESMSLGTPVIAFNYGSRKEILKNAKNSFVVSLENFNDVIKKTKSVIGKEYQEISLNAKKFAMDYDEEVILDKQIELYDKLLFSK